jgi:hypothetical protein
MIDCSDTCAGCMESGFPRVRYSERILVDHPSTVEAEVVDLINIIPIVNSLEVSALYARGDNLDRGGQGSPEPRKGCCQAIGPLRVALG